MKPAPFAYQAPATLDEVVDVLRADGDDTKVLAGGQSLIPMLNLRLAAFSGLVDLRRVEGLGTIERHDGALSIGAMVRQHELEDDPTLAATAPLVARATPLIGHFQIRSRGTFGGSLAHADPAAELPAVALALDAELDAVGPDGPRTIAARDFFLGTWWTALDDAEVLVRARVPSWPATAGFAIEEVARRHGDFAIAGAACAIDCPGGTVGRVAISLFGMGSTPTRAAAVEDQLTGEAVATVDGREVGHAAVAELDPPDDLHASSELRRRIGAAVVSRALARAIEEASR